MLHRRTILATALILPVAAPAFAQGAAESFVKTNIQRGMDILNDSALSADERRKRFADFLLDLTDMRRVAVFLLGRYAQTASPEQVNAFVDAFRDYSMAVYQSYFAQYAGQTLTVTGARQHAPGDDIVTANFAEPGKAPMEVDFRVRSDGPRPVLVDIAVAGIWLGLAQRDEFSAVLAKSNGDIAALIQHLREKQALYH